MNARRSRWEKRCRRIVEGAVAGASREEAFDGFGKGIARGLFIPTKFSANHVEEAATIHILTLQPARKNVSASQIGAGGNVSGVRDQIVIAPTAAIQAFAIPSHSRVERFIDSAEREMRAVELREITADTRQVGDVRSMPGRSQRIGD